MTTAFEFSATDIAGKPRKLADYRGKVLLVVNTASQCGLTPHYKGLQELHEKYGDRGLAILGFPCNQFGAQEPGDESAIAEFCEVNYGVTFPMFAKIDVNGPNTHPLFGWLKEEAPGLLGTRDIKWNFTKFLIRRGGRALGGSAPPGGPPNTDPAFKKALAGRAPPANKKPPAARALGGKEEGGNSRDGG